MTLDYSCQYRGIPSLDHGPADDPMDWTVSFDTPVWAEGNSDDLEDDSRGPVGNAYLSIVPDAGLIDLFDTLHAVNQMLANVGEMLTVKRPDLMPNAGIGKTVAAKPTGSRDRPHGRPAYSPDRLSGLMISSRSVASHAVPPAILHDQVSGRRFRAGRNPRSI